MPPTKSTKLSRESCLLAGSAANYIGPQPPGGRADFNERTWYSGGAAAFQAAEGEFDSRSSLHKLQACGTNPPCSDREHVNGVESFCNPPNKVQYQADGGHGFNSHRSHKTPKQTALAAGAVEKRSSVGRAPSTVGGAGSNPATASRTGVA